MGDDANARPDAAARMLGLPGFVVLAAGEYGGELELLVETRATLSGGCEGCGVVAPRTGGASTSCATSEAAGAR